MITVVMYVVRLFCFKLSHYYSGFLSLTLPLSLKEADTNVHAIVEDILKEHDTTKVLPYCLHCFEFLHISSILSEDVETGILFCF